MVEILPLLAAAAERTEPLLMRLEPQERAKVLMALLGLVLVGTMLIALAYLGGRHLRRIARRAPRASRDPSDDWYRKPLVPHEPPPPPAPEPE